jgi:hypothetical protein
MQVASMLMYCGMNQAAVEIPRRQDVPFVRLSIADVPVFLKDAYRQLSTWPVSQFPQHGSCSKETSMLKT